jgi:hypothetical protein
MESQRDTYVVGYAPAQTAELHGQQDGHYDYSYGSGGIPGGYPLEYPAQEYDNTYSWYSGYAGLSKKTLRRT